MKKWANGYIYETVESWELSLSKAAKDYINGCDPLTIIKKSHEEEDEDDNIINVVDGFTMFDDTENEAMFIVTGKSSNYHLVNWYSEEELTEILERCALEDLENDE